MRIRNKMLLAFLVCTTAAASLYGYVNPLSLQEEASIQTFVFGPGADNLSSGDPLAVYQWGLKNDGELKLIETKDKFSNVGTEFKGTESVSEAAAPRLPGPGNYERITTLAETGIDINVLPAWKLYDSALTKREVVVAIIDTGIDISHPELQNAIWTNSDEIPGDGIDNDGNGYIDDINGWNFFYGTNQLYNGKEDNHGTHAAGTIAATRKSGGIAGITDNSYVKIMPLKALGTQQGLGKPSDVAEAIKYAEANGASICNLSFGTLKYSKDLDDAIKNSKMLFVVAAGNGNSQGIGYDTDTSPIYPACLPYDNVISVENLMFNGQLDSSSNFGAASVDIAAPGTYILSTVTDSKYGFLSGTSMAAPMVTGVAAMLYSYRPDMSLTDVKHTILNSARKMDLLEGKSVTGGVLDAYAAMNYQK